MAFHIPNTNLGFTFVRGENEFGNPGFECIIFMMMPESANGPDRMILTRKGAFCDSRDSWDRDKGRRLALAKALTAAGLPRPERILFWEVYNNR